MWRDVADASPSDGWCHGLYHIIPAVDPLWLFLLSSSLVC